MGRVEVVARENAAEVLAQVLAAPGVARLAARSQVESFRRYLDVCGIDWEALRVVSQGRVRGVVLTLLLPGATAVVMPASPGEHGMSAEAVEEVLREQMARLESRRPHYAQALLEPEADAKRAVLERVGFRRLTRLLYLDRRYDRRHAPQSEPTEAQWVTFGDKTYDAFAETLAATYEQSLDCPELTGLRPMNDIIASHQATGHFDPALWEIVRVEGGNAGCLLLSELTQAGLFEVVYTGVVPAYRGRGVGKLLMRRALWHCGRRRARQLMVVVDERNRPARKLYAGFGLAQSAAREAYLYRWV